MQWSGSPPRVRGKVAGVCACNVVQGITPAYAGKSCTGINYVVQERDHPRVCGEKSTSEAQKSSDMGSPPRMRGKELGFHIVAVKIGITPAYAGKSFMWTKFCRETRDHPRVCGEKGKNHPRKPYCEGLPPRVRGKVLKLQNALKKFRITPAYAGKRPRTLLAGSSSRDHPRVCGEKPGGRLRELVYPGSPPRMRGKV